ncbi:hypothetical protein MNR01_12560 [Lysobacter sp. S4-A87]|uniref:hypothetical protein n=1 Tax=Lysobacter sp. S4-A87 TaxID=2925843 RepID=UPI001F52E6F1|nr:hypothetical protein [Lysobacter sp. S4-A87]UNK48577.1 hypothetical protein MNR01_12560 [Lysobacter sp. S4-A87]
MSTDVMRTYPPESELIVDLDRHDELVRLCASGRLPFWDFCATYDNFYWRYALDGNDADATDMVVLGRLADRIAPHQHLADTVLASVCSDSHPENGSYGRSGRFGPEEAMVRLRAIAETLPRATA